MKYRFHAYLSIVIKYFLPTSGIGGDLQTSNMASKCVSLQCRTGRPSHQTVNGTVIKKKSK